MASVANWTRSSGRTSFPGLRFLLRVERRLRFPLPGRPKARECLSIRVLWPVLGDNCKPKFRSPSTQGAIISPIRLRNRSEMANKPDVSVKFGFGRISGSCPEVRLSRYLPSVWRQRAISLGAPRKNHTSETSHLAGSIRDVGPGDHCGSVAVVLSKC